MKKSQKTLFKEAFAKSFDERYAEMPRGEKMGYWICCALAFGSIAFMWWG